MHRVMHQLVHYSPWDAWSPLQMPCAECPAMASLVMEIETKTQMGEQVARCQWAEPQMQLDTCCVSMLTGQRANRRPVRPELLDMPGMHACMAHGHWHIVCREI